MTGITGCEDAFARAFSVQKNNNKRVLEIASAAPLTMKCLERVMITPPCAALQHDQNNLHDKTVVECQHVPFKFSVSLLLMRPFNRKCFPCALNHASKLVTIWLQVHQLQSGCKSAGHNLAVNPLRLCIFMPFDVPNLASILLSTDSWHGFFDRFAAPVKVKEVHGSVCRNGFVRTDHSHAFCIIVSSATFESFILSNCSRIFTQCHQALQLQFDRKSLTVEIKSLSIQRNPLSVKIMWHFTSSVKCCHTSLSSSPEP